MHRYVALVAAVLLALHPVPASARSNGVAEVGAPLSASLLSASAPEADALGTTWEECETLTMQICGTWSRVGEGSTWNARWSNGAVATLTITWDGRSVTVTRNDQSGPSRGLQATYRGTLSDDGAQVLDGKVDWYFVSGNRNGTWSATLRGVQVAAPAQEPQPAVAQEPPPPLGDCLGQQEAVDVMKTRLVATQATRELAQNMLQQMVDQYNEKKEQTYWQLSVDVAFMAATGPFGEMAEKALVGEVERTLADKLIKAGITSVEQRILKEKSLGGVFDQMTKLAFTEGARSDIAWTAAKEELEGRVGKEIAGTVFGVWDIFKFGLSAMEAYSGVSGLQFWSDTQQQVSLMLNQLDREFDEQLEIREYAGFATDNCQDRLARGLPADGGISTFQWDRVQQYLLIEHPD